MDRENQKGNIRRPIPYRFGRHGGFDEEWGLHKGVSEWWYATGTLGDEAGRMFSYQFTMLRIKAAFLRPYILMLALTDFETGRHRYYQNITLKTDGITVTGSQLRFKNEISLEKGKQSMRLSIRQKEFTLELELEYGKGAVWHCDDGFLQMGIPGKRQTTMYYSYPNMPTRGTLTLGGATRRVTGKTWFDKQGGPYSLLNPRTHWEWFSLRFFDNEEMMLFSFPQDDVRDGTYIRADGASERLDNYAIKALEFVRPEGGETEYAFAWAVETPGRKEERYTIRPLLDGQMNLGYYELLAGVYNPSGALVGHCFVELLPGARNKKFAVQLFRKAEK